MPPLLYPDLTGAIRHAVYDVHNKLGPLWSEETYETALAMALGKRGLQFARQQEFEVYYRDHRVGLYRPDVDVEQKVLLELKAVPELFPLHEAQLISYLKVTGRPLGLLISFGAARADIRTYPNKVSGKNALNVLLEFPEFPTLGDLSHQLLRMAHGILTELGPGFFHQVYRRAFWYELTWAEVPFRVLKSIQAEYEGEVLETREMRAFLVDGQLLLWPVALREEVFAVDDLTRAKLRHFTEYFEAKLGLVVNFNNVRLDYRFWRNGGG
jgi:GxxExxY protein